ncbi:ATP-dependent 6-phosphofructokinase, partial [bacterium]|nr:ATP-dependent 6-phosphofructokinase [bacterium]
TGKRIRLTVLGHTLRGGNPTYVDRCLAREFGEAAFNLLVSGESGRMVTWSLGKTGHVALSDITGKTRNFDLAKYRAVNGD